MDIKSTTDYEIFKQLKGNRRINQSHLSHLIKSIDERNLLKVRPILVNERMEVIDGQHRLEAAKILKTEIYYYVVDNLDFLDTAKINSCQANWVLTDYIDMYCNQGYENYIKLKDFVKKHNADMALIIEIISYSGGDLYSKSDFKMGKYKFEMDNGSVKIIEMHKKMYDLYKQITLRDDKIANFLRRKGFYRAFVHFASEKNEIGLGVDWDVFFKHMSMTIGTIACRATMEQYLIMLQGIYNYRLRCGKV